MWYVYLCIYTCTFYIFYCVYIYCMCIYTLVCVCVLEYYSSIKKNEILSFVTTWIDHKGIMLIEVSEYDKCHMISLIHEISKQNKLINKTKLEIQRGFLGSSVGTESVCNAGDMGWEDPMDRGA